MLTKSSTTKIPTLTDKDVIVFHEEQIWASCVISVSRNDSKCEQNIICPSQDSACKELVKSGNEYKRDCMPPTLWQDHLCWFRFGFCFLFLFRADTMLLGPLRCCSWNSCPQSMNSSMINVFAYKLGKQYWFFCPLLTGHMGIKDRILSSNTAWPHHYMVRSWNNAIHSTP